MKKYLSIFFSSVLILVGLVSFANNVSAIAVTPAIILGTSSAIIGDSVSISGSHFHQGDTITVSINGHTGNISSSALVVSGNTFSGSIVIPADATLGSDTVAATNGSTDTATAPLTVSAPVVTHTLTYTAGAHGSITGTSPQTINDGASGSAVTAVPDSGYHFLNWTPGGSTSASRTDTNVTSDQTYTANFEADVVVPVTYTLTYTAGANGTLTGSTTQVVDQGTDGSAVTAVANSGYHFTTWSDATTTNPRTDLNVQGNVNVTANFVVDVASSTNGYTISIDLPSIIGYVVNLTGFASTTNATGNAPQYDVQILWGDASTTDTSPHTFSPSTGNFSGPWGTDSHTYASAGTYTIEAKLYHGSLSGNDGDATTTVQVTVPVSTSTPDTTAPVFGPTPDITVSTTSTSTPVDFTVTATDAVDGTTTVNCVPASGSTFASGTTPVLCSTSDSSENTATTTFNVIVIHTEAPDTTPPVITGTPENISATTTGTSTIVTYTPPTAYDAVVGTTTVTCIPPSGSLFNLGTTTVACSTTDGTNNASSSFAVIVTQVSSSTSTSTSTTTSTGGGSTSSGSSSGGSTTTGGSSGNQGSEISLNDLITVLALLGASGGPAAPAPVVVNTVPVAQEIGVTPAPETAGTTTEEAAGAASTTGNELPLAAAVGTAGGFNFSWWWVVAILIIAGIIYILYRRRE